MAKEALAVFPLPAASLNTPAPTEIDAVPEEPAAGVNVAVYEVPEPLKPENVPPETVTSLSIKLVEVSDNVNVNTSVEPTPSEPEPLLAMETVGTTVSYAMFRVVLAMLLLGTASVNNPAPTAIDAVPDELAVGVNVAVYEDPEPLKPDNKPPETVTSPTTKFVDDSDKVNVNKSVPPTPKVPEPFREIETVGGVVSIVTVPVDAAEMLPAASAARTLYVPSARPVTASATLELIVEIGTEFHMLSAALVILPTSDTVTEELTKYAVPVSVL
jgi:hypothetical protein